MSLVKIIRYKCLICGYEHEYDKTWTDAKKAEVQAEMDAHHAEHIIPYKLYFKNYILKIIF